MDSFVPNNRHLWEIILYFYNLKKSAAKRHSLLVKVNMLKIQNVKIDRKNLKMQICKYYWMKTTRKRNKNWLTLNVVQSDVSRHLHGMEKIQNLEIGYYMD